MLVAISLVLTLGTRQSLQYLKIILYLIILLRIKYSGCIRKKSSLVVNHVVCTCRHIVLLWL